MGKAETILITGATAGIGRTAALYLVQKGHRVIASGRKKSALEELKREASTAATVAAAEGKGGAGSLDTVELDVTDKQSIARAAWEVDRLTEGRGVSVLINNAGYGQSGALEDVDDATFRAQFETNVFGLMAVTRAFLPGLRANGGRILNVSSIGGRVTFPLFGAYHASKYAVEALSDSLRRELAAFGVKVVLIEPGPIKTEFGDRALAAVEAVRRPDSNYSDVYAKAEDIKRITESQAVSPVRVARAIERAIVARRPRARYVTPFWSGVMLFMLNALPVRFVDLVMRWSIGLGRRREVPALPAHKEVAA